MSHNVFVSLHGRDVHCKHKMCIGTQNFRQKTIPTAKYRKNIIPTHKNKVRPNDNRNPHRLSVTRHIHTNYLSIDKHIVVQTQLFADMLLMRVLTIIIYLGIWKILLYMYEEMYGITWGRLFGLSCDRLLTDRLWT